MNAKFSQSFKKQAVKKALMREVGVSLKTISIELSIGYSTLQKWIVQTKNHELESSNDLSTNKHSMKHEKRPEDWSSQEKLAVIIHNHVSQLCRSQGIYPHHIKQWSNDFIKSDVSKTKIQPATSQMKRKIKLLTKELNRKDKALAETAALLVLQKKVNFLWNTDGED